MEENSGNKGENKFFQHCPPLPDKLMYNSIIKKHQEKPKGISQVLFSCRKINTERRKRLFESDR